MSHRCGSALLLLALCATPAPAEEGAVKKVLIIGIDGCRPDALLAAKAPHLHGLIKSGAFSDKAQTGDMTASGGGWGSLLTGVWREKHGVRGNDFKGANFGAFPDVLTRVKKARPNSYVASVVHWEPIQQHIVQQADVSTAYKTDVEVARNAAELLSEKDCDLLFVHFDDVDGAGHKHGFDPKEPRYLAAIAEVDQHVGTLLRAVENRRSYGREDWLIVVSTDHGGSGKGHGRDVPEHRTIFLIVSGKSAATGTIEPAPVIVDVAPTALHHLGIKIDPQWKLDGKPVGLKGLAPGKAKKVLFIGIDGCRPDAIPAALEAANLHALIKEGAYSDKTDVLGDRKTGADTATGPGWASALTGVWADRHGVPDNAFRTPHFDQYPTFFRRLKESRPDAVTVALVTWLPFKEHYFPASDGCRLVLDGDKKGYLEGDKAVAKEAVKALGAKDLDALFVYFGNVDCAGHGYGFHPKSPRYTKEIETVDGYIGDILKAFRARPTYAREDWLLIVCTDHGGKGRGHGAGANEPECRTGFLILHGPSVEKGAIEGKIYNVDVAATALTHLGVVIKPEWKFDGRPVGLKK